MGPKKNHKNKNKQNHNSNIKQSKEEEVLSDESIPTIVTPTTTATTTITPSTEFPDESSVDTNTKNENETKPSLPTEVIESVVAEVPVVVPKAVVDEVVLEKVTVAVDTPTTTTTATTETTKTKTTTNNNVILENKEPTTAAVTVAVATSVVVEQQAPQQQVQQVQQVEDENNLNKDWKTLYFLTSKQMNLERIKTETLESLIIQKDKENQQLLEQVNKLETELLTERRRINRTVGTLRQGTRKLLSTVKFDQNIDIASIIDDLNNIDSSISASPSFADNLTSASITNSPSNSFTEFSSDQLLHKLNSYHNSASSLMTGSNNGERSINISNLSNGGGNGSIRLSTSTNSINSIGDNNNPSLVNSASSVNNVNNTTAITLNNNTPVNAPKRDYIQSITFVQSLVRKWLARKRYKKLRTKRAIVEELYETESTYVSHISNLLKIFVNPLKAKKGDSILPSDEFDSIFSSITLIYKTNSYFLDQVEEIFKKFNKWSCFGEKLLKLVPLFNCYTDYIINFECSQKNLKKALSSNSTFSNFVKQGNSKKELDDLDLEDLLIMPVQRVPRYIMLFKEIRKFTPLYHADFSGIDKTLEAFRSFADSLNKRSGHRKQVLQLDDRILNYKDDITSNSRILVKEGQLKFKKSNEYAFLFNDMILICHPTHSKKIKKPTLSATLTSSTLSANSSTNSILNGGTTSSSSTTPTSTTPNTTNAPPSPILRDDKSANTSNINLLNGVVNGDSILNISNGSFGSTSTASSSINIAAINEFHSSNTDINFKFISKFVLDARVKIVQDLTEPKFTVLVPDSYSVDFIAQSIDDRQSWITEINKIVSIISNNNLNQINIDSVLSLY